VTGDGGKQPPEHETAETDHGFEVIDSWDDPDKPIDPSAPRPEPLGPHADPTFPSLPAGASERPEMRGEPLFEEAVSTVPLTCNVFALTSSPATANVVSAGPGQVEHPEDFDRPERQRMADIASEFVAGHVRVIRHDLAIKTPHRHFGVGTIVISQDPVPTTVLRHARFQWAITDGTVVELRNVRIPVGHLEDYEPPATISDGEGWPGVECGLAIFLAFLFEILRISSPVPLGAVGDINFNTNAIGAVSDIDAYLERAQSGELRDLMLPFMNGKTTGMHNQVRYWSVRDTNEAAYSALAYMAGEVVVPNLYRRALTKQAYSWLSLILALAAVLAYALATSFNAGGDAPKGFLELVLLLVVLFVIGSETCTRRYWKRDR
jgi:hypothetical protein